MAKKYKLSIELDKKDKQDIQNVLSLVAKGIEDGFTSGIDYPVNWTLKTKQKPINPKYEHFKFINENGKALDDNFNEYRDESGCCVYVSKSHRKNFQVVKH
jgi:hypothetical protein